MKAALSIIFFLLWILLGYFYWQDSIICCDQSDTGSTEEISIIPEENEEVLDDSSPILFEFNSPSPITGANWDSIRSKIMDSLNGQNNLEIIGKYFSDETGAVENEDLGLTRASNIRALFSEIPDDRFELSSQRLDQNTNNYETDLYEIRVKVINEDIKEIKDRTRIYFPFQSAKRLTNDRIEAYLDDVAERVKRTGEQVELIGHTDNISSKKSNMRLGLKRAQVIADYLSAKGVATEKLIVSSKGEEEPVASNETPEGRSENRRVELQIVKK